MPPFPEATTSSTPTDALLGDTDEPEDSKKHEAQAARRGLFLLATVPLVWGTYAPSVKYVYDLGDGLSPPALIFNFGCYFFSAATLAGAAWIRSVQNLSVDCASGHRESGVVSEQGTPLNDKRYGIGAGLELGGWLFLGSTAQASGLELTSATSAAFLVQLTTVIVPVLEAVLGRRRLKGQVWAACLLATVGVALVSLGSLSSSQADVVAHLAETGPPPSLWGDVLVALSAVFYSLHVVRLGAHVAHVEPLTLARYKSLSELLYSTIVLGIAAAFGGQGGTFAKFGNGMMSNTGALTIFAAVIAWNGAVTTAYAMWAQSRGQTVVAPSVANLVYSMQPLWSTFFAVLFLKESLGMTQGLGAVLVLASLLVATSTNFDVNQQREAEDTPAPPQTHVIRER